MDPQPIDPPLRTPRHRASVGWAIVGLVGAGAGLAVGGAFADGYLASALLDIGVALLLAVPLLFVERLVEFRIGQLAAAAEQSIDSVRNEIEHVRRDVRHTRIEIDRLGQATADRIAAARAADADGVQALRDDPSAENTRRLIRRAAELSAIDARGARVRLPFAPLWIRFAAGAESVVAVSVEDRDGELLAGEEEWSPAEGAEQALARLAEGLQRVDRYPGDRAFDTTSVFKDLADTLGTVLALRTGGREGARLGPVVELAGEWAITADGLEHLEDDNRALTVEHLLPDPEAAQAALEAEAEVLATAVAYHRGEARRAARRLVPELRAVG